MTTTTAALLGATDARMSAPRFFGLLLLVSAVPLALLPVSANLLPGVPTLDHTTSVLLLLGSQGHVAASFFFYTEPRARGFMLGKDQRARFVFAPLVAVLGTAAVLYFASGAVLSYVVLGFWIWQTHHYTRQNHGILAFSSVAAGVRPAPAERTAVTLCGVAGILGMIRFVTPWDATFLAGWGWHLHATAIGVFACGWGWYLASLRDPDARRSPLRMAVVAMLMLFYLPLFFFQDALSAVFAYAVAHGLQYLVFMWVVASSPAERKRLAVGSVVALTLLGGLVLKATELSGGIFGAYNSAVFGAGLGVVMWHFLLDAGIWRLSEPFPREYMGERFSFLRAPR